MLSKLAPTQHQPTQHHRTPRRRFRTAGDVAPAARVTTITRETGKSTASVVGFRSATMVSLRSTRIPNCGAETHGPTAASWTPTADQLRDRSPHQG